MNEPILKVDRLVKKYEQFALKELSFNLPRGYIMGFVGRNGSGKSTTIRCIMDLIKYDAGKIQVFGLDNREHSVAIKDRIGYVGEEQYFYEDMKVSWNVKFISSFFTDWDQNFFNRLIQRFTVDPNKHVNELSRGMKVKLSLAIAMAHRPELLILDEPTSGLDPVIRNELLEIFQEIIQDERCSIFFSSHIISDIEKVADYITIVDDGKLILSEEKDALLERWKLVKAENTYYHPDLCKYLVGIKKSDFGFSGITENYGDLVRLLKNNFGTGGFITEKLNLEELMVRMLKDDQSNVGVN